MNLSSRARSRHPQASGLLAGLLISLLLCSPLPVVAADFPTRAALPEPVVLVVKILSETHARPVTGVVLAPAGSAAAGSPALVLVPADFVAAGDELLVLDGGTDLARNGRKARTLARDAEAGLAVLEVVGLTRRGLVISAQDRGPADPSANSPADLSAHQTAPVSAHLAAFPTAEGLASGAAPFWVSGPELPNLSGPLLDACGQLAGYHLGQGTPAAASNPGAMRVSAETILAFLAEWNLAVASQACGASSVEELPEAAAAEAAGQIEPVTNEPAPEIKESTDTAAESPPVAAGPGTESETADSIGAPDSTSGTGRIGIPVTALLLLLALGITTSLAWLLHSRRRRARQAEAERTAAAARLAADSAATLPTRTIPGVELLCTSSTGEQYRAFCACNPDCFELLAGRPGADLAIDHPHLERLHARLRGDSGGFSMEDLGSMNGSRVGMVPCLPGEILRFGATEMFQLADLSCRLRATTGTAA